MKTKTFRSERQNLSKKKYQPPKGINAEHQEFMTKVGSKIEELRKKKGIIISELCRQVKMSRYGYYLMIGGKVYWNSETLLNILSFLKQDEVKFFRSLK